MASHGLTVGFIWLIVTGFTGPATAQHTIPAQPSELILRGGTREVLLDFVVRDKHQREVKDIRPEEVEIYEDGALPTAMLEPGQYDVEVNTSQQGQTSLLASQFLVR